MSIGQQLKEAREKLGFDERSASDRTHIRRHYIIAMENDDFDSIDLAPVYRIGFLRIYAKLLKLNADALVSEFKESQNSKATGTRSTFRLTPIKPMNPEPSDAEDPFSSAPFPPPGGRTSRKLTIAASAIAIVAVALVSVFALKACSGDATSETTTVATANEGPAYEIEITTNTAQKITIREQYKNWDSARAEPIAGAPVLDEYVPAGRTTTRTVRGIIFVKEEVPGGCKIKYPSKKSFENAGDSKLIPIGADEPRQMNGTTNTSWLLNPNK